MLYNKTCSNFNIFQFENFKKCLNTCEEIKFNKIKLKILNDQVIKSSQYFRFTCIHSLFLLKQPNNKL